MAENIILRLLENIVPLLLVIIIMAVILYVLIKKILSPFSALGNFLWDKSTGFYNKVAHTRKTKLEAQLKTIKSESSEWKNKYILSTNAILEIKDKLNDLSKIFTELNEMEIGNVVMENELNENKKQTDELKASIPKNIFSGIITGIKLKKLAVKNARTEKAFAKYEQSVLVKKESIKEKINELLESVNNLSV